MDITINASILPLDDPAAALAFYRDVLGFEVRNDVGKGAFRWITVEPADQPDQGPGRTFKRLQATDAVVVPEPTEQPYGVRDCALRAPAGNMVRIQEVG